MERCRDRHPELLRLKSFMHGGLPRDEVREIVRHLLTGCRSCVVVTRPLWILADQPLLRTDEAPGAVRVPDRE